MVSTIQDGLFELHGLSDMLSVVCDYHSDGLIIIDCKGQMRWANKSAQMMFDAKHRGIFQIRGRVVLADPGAQERLQRNLSRLAHARWSAAHFTYCVRTKGYSVPLIVMHRAMRALARGEAGKKYQRRGDFRRLSCLIVRDPTMQGGFDSQVFQQMFDLTETEAELANHFVNGGDVHGFAQLRQTSIDTAREHLKNLMHKCGVHKQAELMSLLMASWMDVL